MGFWSWRCLPLPHSREEGMSTCPLGFWLLLLSPRRGWFPFSPPPPEGPVPATPFYIIPPASSIPTAPSPCPAPQGRLFLPAPTFCARGSVRTPAHKSDLLVRRRTLSRAPPPPGCLVARRPAPPMQTAEVDPAPSTQPVFPASLCLPRGATRPSLPPPLHTAWHPENNREAIVVTLRPHSKWFLPGSLPWLTSPNSTITCWY